MIDISAFLLTLKSVVLVVIVCLLLDPVVDPLPVMLIYMVAALSMVAAGLRAGFDWSVARPWREPRAVVLFLGCYSVVVAIGVELVQSDAPAFTLLHYLEAAPGSPITTVYTIAAFLLLAALPISAAIYVRRLAREAG